jgi:hypothetical protein
MSIIREFGSFRTNFEDMPVWAQLVVVLCVCAIVTILANIILMETSIYHSSPSVPMAASGQIYPVHVMRGFLRYVTRGELERLTFWNNKFQFGFIAAMAIYVILFAYRTRERS